MPKPNELSPFGQAALALDHDFTELERLAGQLERLDIETDIGLEKGTELLVKFTDCGQRMTAGIQGLAQALNETRTRAEAAAERVSVRANAIGERHRRAEAMNQRFQGLAESVREVSAGMTEITRSRDEAGTGPSAQWPSQVVQLDARVGALIDEAARIREEAHQLRMKGVERNAESLGHSLQNARRKITRLLPGQEPRA